jgi:hypothetical protein
MSGDETKCAMAVAAEGKIEWMPLSGEWVDRIRHAMRVGKRDIAADLVICPFQRSRITKDAPQDGGDRQ